MDPLPASSPSSLAPLPVPPSRLRRGDIAEIVDTHDEWEGLLGLVDDFLDEDGARCRSDHANLSCVVLQVPTGRGEAVRGSNLRRLYEANELTSYVKSQLRTEDDRCCRPSTQLAWYDPNWL